MSQSNIKSIIIHQFHSEKKKINEKERMQVVLRGQYNTRMFLFDPINWIYNPIRSKFDSLGSQTNCIIEREPTIVYEMILILKIHCRNLRFNLFEPFWITYLSKLEESILTLVLLELIWWRLDNVVQQFKTYLLVCVYCLLAQG